MRVSRFAVAIFIAGAFSTAACGQNELADHRPRLLLDGEIGSERQLGYKLPSTAVGPSIEIPLWNHFEVQALASYSPDRKEITGDGESLKLGGSVIGFATRRWGLVASVDHAALWTSEFDKKNWFPSTGIVLRNDVLGPGRLYVTYLLPTGCVWATPSNPCTIQSNRLQGVQIHEDVRSWSHGRWGLESGIYHFCDQGNPNEPQAGRKCHMGVTMLATFALELHLGHRSHLWNNGDPSDNF